MSPPLLAMSAVQARRGPGFRLGPVTLAVAPGEVVAVLGPNGAGKSTLLALAVGELAPDSGTVSLDGGAPRELGRAEVAKRAALCRQRTPAAFEMAVLDVVLQGRWIHGTGLRFPGARDIALARASLARLDAEHLADRDFRTLSGGEQQRVLLARAVAQEARLLLLDEPTTGLDLRHRWELMGLIATLPERASAGVVLVTHDLDLAAAAADRMLLLRDGTVVAEGSPEAVLEPQILENAFGWPVLVDRHPGTGRPRVTPRLSGRA